MKVAKIWRNTEPLIAYNVACVPLTRGRYTLVDVGDLPLVEGFKWHYTGYACRSASIGGGQYRQLGMHRVLLGVAPHEHVDHINGNKLDNRRSNLRVCTRSQNGMNAGPRSHGKSKYKGVTMTRGGFEVYVCKKGMKSYIGRFSDEVDAAKEYDRVALERHGEFARINFPEARQ